MQVSQTRKEARRPPKSMSTKEERGSSGREESGIEVLETEVEEVGRGGGREGEEVTVGSVKLEVRGGGGGLEGKAEGARAGVDGEVEGFWVLRRFLGWGGCRALIICTPKTMSVVLWKQE